MILLQKKNMENTTKKTWEAPELIQLSGKETEGKSPNPDETTTSTGPS